jgi:large subunit ribosomal protein L6
LQGPKGELSHQFHPLVTVEQDGDILKVSRNEDTKAASAMHGMSRALCANMLNGVSQGFEKKLELRGVGYRAAVSGQELTLSLGYSHPVVMQLPEVVSAKVENSTLITVESCDKEILGNVAAVIRSKRPPEPYKGKGIRCDHII